MIIATQKNLARSWLLLMVSTAALTKADSDPSSFICGNPQGATEVSSTTTTTGASSFFDTIETSLRLDNWNNRDDQLIPQTINWHIYAIDDGETPKYSCYPEGLVKPQISGSTLQLAATKDRLEELGYHQGDKIQSSVNLYIPLKQLRNIQMDGVGEVVEVVVTDKLLTNVTSSAVLPSIRIDSSGVGSNLYVNAPYSPIYFSGSGVQTGATMLAGPDSTVDLSGVKQRVRIMSDMIGDIGLSGVNIRLMVEGDYDAIDMSGVTCKVEVNGPSGCNNVHNSGVNNNCAVANTNITVPELDCLSTTTVVEGSCGFSVWGIVGVSVGVAIVIALCVWCACRGRRRRRQQEKEQHMQVSSPLQIPVGSSMPPAMTVYEPQKMENVREAEVIEIEPSQTMMDAELAKGSEAKVYA